jgi:GNAT superfamily N-acetyltransferase
MKIGYSPSAGNTEAFAIIAEGWNELVQEGYTPDRDGGCPVSPSDEVFYAVSKEGDLVGVLTYKQETLGVARVTLAYVEPSSRKRGVFNALLAALKDRCQKVGWSRIDGLAAPNNEAALRTMKSIGGYVQTILYSVPV